MNANQIRDAINWINTNIGSAPVLLHSNLMNTNEKLNKQLSKIALSSELKEKQDELKKISEGARAQMKELQQKIKEQREIEKKQREEHKARRQVERAAKAKERAAKKAERDAALIAKAAKLQGDKKATSKAMPKK